jgi:hypothetical protein
VRDFIRAYRDGAVCVVGPFRSQLMHDKRIFTILRDPTMVPFLTRAEKAFIERHIPLTLPLDRATRARLDIVGKRRDFVLKPTDSYAARGVYIGRDHSLDRWTSLVEDCQRSGGYLVQEFARSRQYDLVNDTPDGLATDRFRTISGLFVYNGKLRGMYTRAGQKSIIASAAQSYVMPTIGVGPIELVK